MWDLPDIAELDIEEKKLLITLGESIHKAEASRSDDISFCLKVQNPPQLWD